MRVELALAGELFGTAIPAPITAWISEDPPAYGIAERYGRLLAAYSRTETDNSTRDLLYLQAREQWSARAAYLLGLTFMPALLDWESFPLPDALFPLYYLYRPLRLLTRTAVRVLRLPFRGLAERAAARSPRPYGAEDARAETR